MALSSDEIYQILFILFNVIGIAVSNRLFAGEAENAQKNVFFFLMEVLCWKPEKYGADKVKHFHMKFLKNISGTITLLSKDLK